MALISCPECNSKISDRAKVCPHCGFPIADHLRESPTPVIDENQEKKCPYCGEIVEVENYYCEGCGMRLKDYIPLQNDDAVERAEVVYKCLNCGESLIHGEQSCPICGSAVPDERTLEDDMLYCPTCGGLNPLGSFACIHCGRKYSINDMINCVIKAEKPTTSVKIEMNAINQNVAKCPRCGSTSVTYINKKLSVGRAIVGGMLFNAPGAIMGGLSSKKGKAKCLKCGKEWKI